MLILGYNPIKLFKSPKLELNIHPTEAYKIDGTSLMIKRISLTNNEFGFKEVRLNIRAPQFINSIRIDTDPELQFSTNKYHTKEGLVIFEVTFSSFSPSQKSELILIGHGEITGEDTIVVEALGAYNQDKYIGTSATGKI